MRIRSNHGSGNNASDDEHSNEVSDNNVNNGNQGSFGDKEQRTSSGSKDDNNKGDGEEGNETNSGDSRNADHIINDTLRDLKLEDANEGRSEEGYTLGSQESVHRATKTGDGQDPPKVDHDDVQDQEKKKGQDNKQGGSNDQDQVKNKDSSNLDQEQKDGKQGDTGELDGKLNDGEGRKPDNKKHPNDEDNDDEQRKDPNKSAAQHGGVHSCIQGKQSNDSSGMSEGHNNAAGSDAEQRTSDADNESSARSSDEFGSLSPITPASSRGSFNLYDYLLQTPTPPITIPIIEEPMIFETRPEYELKRMFHNFTEQSSIKTPETDDLEFIGEKKAQEIEANLVQEILNPPYLQKDLRRLKRTKSSYKRGPMSPRKMLAARKLASTSGLPPKPPKVPLSKPDAKEDLPKAKEQPEPLPKDTEESKAQGKTTAPINAPDAQKVNTAKDEVQGETTAPIDAQNAPKVNLHKDEVTHQSEGGTAARVNVYNRRENKEKPKVNLHKDEVQGRGKAVADAPDEPSFDLLKDHYDSPVKSTHSLTASMYDKIVEQAWEFKMKQKPTVVIDTTYVTDEEASLYSELCKWTPSRTQSDKGPIVFKSQQITANAAELAKNIRLGKHLDTTTMQVGTTVLLNHPMQRRRKIMSPWVAFKMMLVGTSGKTSNFVINQFSFRNLDYDMKKMKANLMLLAIGIQSPST